MQNEHESGATDKLVEDARDLCAIVTESFKKSTSELTKLFFISHNLMSTQQAAIKSLHELQSMLEKKSEIMTEMRKVIVTSTHLHILQLLDEYLSYVYIQYLSAIHFEFEQTELTENIKKSPEYMSARSKLQDFMHSLQEKEAAHRYQVGLKVDPEESEKEREQRLMKLSHLKKFFQSKSFVDFSTKNNVKRIYETLATIGTALAGLTVAVLESFRNASAAQTTFKGIFLLSFGVFAYVLRDRLKDWLKNTLNKKASIYIPDTESNLWAKNEKMGFLREWLRIETKKSIPMTISQKRQNLAGSSLEKALPEDVLHYRKIQSINHTPHEMKSSTGLHAVHENIRINLERYLKHMDDPFKDLAELDAWGSIKKSKSHRVYHFYLCARIKYKTIETSKMDQLKSLAMSSSKPALEKIIVARVVLDKNGVVRVEEA